jgi:diaminopimelate epimerase
MIVKFVKYQGAGNDFIIIDNRDFQVKELKSETIKSLCDRHFGIGSDGLMLLNTHEKYDFEMDYYNADGSGSTMCGNGGRCIVAFAKRIGIISDYTRFLASDGLHEASIDNAGIVKLKMTDVIEIQQNEDSFFINTGAPHHVEFDNDLFRMDVYAKGKEIRYSDKYRKEGTNVDFVQIINNGLKIRTYERGVENETLACGTGAVAAAIAYYQKFNLPASQIKVKVLGGELEVSFNKKDNKYTDVFLSGPAKFIFTGEIELP